MRLKTKCLAMLCLLSAIASAHAWPTVYPTGTTVHDADKAFASFTLFSPLGGEDSVLYLVNMRGETVHRWSVPFAVLYGRLLPNGNVVVIGRNDTQVPGRPGVGPYEIGGVAGWLVELTWEGKRVWKHVDLAMHHDFVKLANGHVIYLAWEKVPVKLQKKVRGGIKGSEFANHVMFGESIVEIDAGGRRVWEWHANLHLDPDIDIIGPMYKRQEWLHANSLTVLKDGNIALTARDTDSLLVIEKKTGKILWRWGNTAYLDRTTGRIEYREGPGTLGGPHNVRQIADGYPGAGHLTCYDNGTYADASRAVEIDSGARKQVWQSAQPGIGRKHFSNFIGGAQRLPNGNTLICDGGNGRIFQVTSQNQVVWEYINPYIATPAYQGAMFRAEAYAPDYCRQLPDLGNP